MKINNPNSDSNSQFKVWSQFSGYLEVSRTVYSLPRHLNNGYVNLDISKTVYCLPRHHENSVVSTQTSREQCSVYLDFTRTVQSLPGQLIQCLPRHQENSLESTQTSRHQFCISRTDYCLARHLKTLSHLSILLSRRVIESEARQAHWIQTTLVQHHGPQ